jgi:hypothetical protein
MPVRRARTDAGGPFCREAQSPAPTWTTPCRAPPTCLASSPHIIRCRPRPIRKGCGEAGCAGALVAIPNAIIDALSDYGICHIDMPVTPGEVWRAIGGQGLCRTATASPHCLVPAA